MGYQQDHILQAPTSEDFIIRLESSRCAACSLGNHGGPIVAGRGNPRARILLVGEAPGKIEEIRRLAFVGPAGKLLDEIFQSIGLDTNTDMRLSNICRCRPKAPVGSGKENYTPSAADCRICSAYILKEIELMDPRIVIACGLPAAKTLFQLRSNTRMGDIAGRTITTEVPQLQNRICFVMRHPAAILHAKRGGAVVYDQAKNQMWQEIQQLILFLGA